VGGFTGGGKGEGGITGGRMGRGGGSLIGVLIGLSGMALSIDRYEEI
jgi:hypothetical protein